VAQKLDIAVCASKIQLLSKKVCYKVSLCENFQRQSCSYIIPLYPTVHRSIAGDVPIYLKLAFKVTHPFRKRRFSKLSFKSASSVTAGTDTFCDINLAQRILFLAIVLCHLWRYSKGITHSEGVKMTNFRLRGCIPVAS